MTAQAVQPGTKQKRRGLKTRRTVGSAAARKVKKNSLKRTLKARFVLVYQGLSDPDASAVERIAQTFRPATVEEVVPGTLKIEGDSAKIKQRADTLASWSLAPEGVMSSRSPSQTRYDHV